MRTKGAAIGTASNWIFNFMVVEITPIGIQNLKWKFYIVWTVLNASFVPLMYFFYPETAGTFSTPSLLHPPSSPSAFSSTLAVQY